MAALVLGEPWDRDSSMRICLGRKPNGNQENPLKAALGGLLSDFYYLFLNTPFWLQV
jgi:hypothetical protein